MGSLHAAFHSKETTDKLSYSSLVQDEVVRRWERAQGYDSSIPAGCCSCNSGCSTVGP